jgi:hypothetical protein
VRLVGGLLLAYGAASLLHFGHNAAFAHAYPNLPAGLTAPRILVVWVAEASIALAGWIAVGRGHARAGLAAIALYAALGFDGLGHYALAPVSAHSLAMNLTIALEAVTAGALLAATGRELRHPRARSS